MADLENTPGALVSGGDIEGDYLDIPDDELFKRPTPEIVTTNHNEDVKEIDVSEEEEEDEAPQEDFDEDEDGDEDEEQFTSTEGETEEEEADDSDEESEEETAPTEVTQLGQVLAPLKAAGATFTPQTVDELRALASKGIHYTKQMQALAPHLKVVKMLENNGLLDESKLSYLIDLDKKDPNAISKLIQESGHDSFDLDEEKAEQYTPNNYTVSDNQMALDSILKEIEHSEGFQTTIDTVGNKWDEASRQVIIDNPEILRDINSHVETGIYQMIVDEMERQRVLGNLNGVSSVHAYKQVGDFLHQQGAFNSVPQGQQQQQLAPLVQNQQQVNKPQAKKAVAKKKRAAGLTKGSPTKKVTKDDFDPLSMSDEEIMKLAKTLNF